MTIKHLMLSLLIVVGISAPLKALSDGLVERGVKCYAAEKYGSKASLKNLTALLVLGILAEKHGGKYLEPWKAILAHVNDVAAVSWLRNAVKEVLSNKLVTENVGKLPIVGPHLAEALFTNADEKASVVAIAASLTGGVHVPYRN